MLGYNENLYIEFEIYPTFTHLLENSAIKC